jgi:hypothetical protein
VVGCPGTAAEPKAEAGNLCVYETYSNALTTKNGKAEEPAKIAIALPGGFGAVTQEELGAGVNGAILTAKAEGTGNLAWGSWAVTAAK